MMGPVNGSVITGGGSQVQSMKLGVEMGNGRVLGRDTSRYQNFKYAREYQ
jgi:hypothetical protein